MGYGLHEKNSGEKKTTTNADKANRDRKKFLLVFFFY